MIKHTQALLFNIALLTVSASLHSMENGPQNFQFFQKELHTNTTAIKQLNKQVNALNISMRPSTIGRMGKLGILSLAAYGSYTLFNDYQQSEYKSMVDEKIEIGQALYALVMHSPQPAATSTKETVAIPTEQNTDEK